MVICGMSLKRRLSMIIKCSCVHNGQDKLHGAQRRVCNECKDTGSGHVYRCTVCVKEHTKPINPQSGVGG